MSSEIQQAQSRLIQANQRLDDLKSKINEREFEENRARLTKRELSSLPAGRATYKRVGRMFVRTPQDALEEELDQTIERVGKELVGLKGQEEYLSRQLADAQRTIQELMFAHAR